MDKSTKLKNLFRFKVFNIVVTLCIVIFAAIGAFTYYNYQRIVQEKIREAESVSAIFSENLRDYFKGLIYKSESILARSELMLTDTGNKINPLKKSWILADLKADSPELEIVAITDANGYYVANSEWAMNSELFEKQKNVTLSDRQYFKDLKDNPDLNFIFSKPLKSKTTGNHVSVLVRRRYNKKGEFNGVIFTTFSISRISEYFGSANPIPDSTITLYYDDNTLFIRSPLLPEKIGQQVSVVEQFRPFLENKINSGHFQGFCPVDQIQKVFGFAIIDDFKIRILWGKSTKLITAAADRHFYTIFLIQFLLLVFIFFLLAFFYKSLVSAEKHKIGEAANAKLAALGELASGIAHEINNPLAIISGKIDLMMRKPDTMSRKDLNIDLLKIKETSNRINKIVKGLINISRQSHDERPIRYPLNKIVQDVLCVVSGSLAENQMTLKVDIPEDLFVNCHPDQLGQVFMNLFSNSIYAVKALDVRWIEVKSEIINKKIRIVFTDSGQGIPPEYRQQILNAFFTSKPPGAGTGLGLSICKKILIDHSGDFYLDEKCANTRFVLELKNEESV